MIENSLRWYVTAGVLRSLLSGLFLSYADISLDFVHSHPDTFHMPLAKTLFHVLLDTSYACLDVQPIFKI